MRYFIKSQHITYMGKCKKVIQKNFKISAPTWNNKFELLGEAYSVSDIQNYLEGVNKKKMDSH